MGLDGLRVGAEPVETPLGPREHLAGPDVEPGAVPRAPGGAVGQHLPDAPKAASPWRQALETANGSPSETLTASVPTFVRTVVTPSGQRAAARGQLLPERRVARR